MDTLRHIELLAEMASRARASSGRSAGEIATTRSWCAPARTFTYHTQVGAEADSPALLDRVADAFFDAASLEAQPWYDGFVGGSARPTEDPPPTGVDRQQYSLSCFDVGLRRPCCYRVLVAAASPAPETRVVSILSVDLDWPIPPRSVLARALAPSGDVFEWLDGRLHWHHIGTNPGVGLLPGVLDRWLLNGLRRLGLDARERRTYREEAEAFRRWVTAEGAALPPTRGATG